MAPGFFRISTLRGDDNGDGETKEGDDPSTKTEDEDETSGKNLKAFPSKCTSRRLSGLIDLDRLSFDIRTATENDLQRMLSLMLASYSDSDLSDLSDFAASVCRGYVVFQHNAAEAPQPSYHGFRHAFDVTQCVFTLLQRTEAAILLEAPHKCALIVAASLHDIGHGGRNNAFLRQTNSDLVERFTGDSTLERMHATISRKIISAHPAVLHYTKDKGHRAMLANLVERLILATDMAHHGDIVEEFKEAAAAGAFTALGREEVSDSPSTLNPPSDDQIRLMKMIIKSADISNVCRPRGCSRYWSDRLAEEFFSQGDAERERGLEVTPVMDRTSITAADADPALEMSIGFTDFVAKKGFEALAAALPRANFMLNGLNRNRHNWEVQRSSTGMSAEDEDDSLREL